MITRRVITYLVIVAQTTADKIRLSLVVAPVVADMVRRIEALRTRVAAGTADRPEVADMLARQQ